MKFKTICSAIAIMTLGCGGTSMPTSPVHGRHRTCIATYNDSNRLTNFKYVNNQVGLTVAIIDYDDWGEMQPPLLTNLVVDNWDGSDLFPLQKLNSAFNCYDWAVVDASVWPASTVIDSGKDL